MAIAFGTDAPASGQYTQQLFDWMSNHRALLEDLEHSVYFDTRTCGGAGARSLVQPLDRW